VRLFYERGDRGVLGGSKVRLLGGRREGGVDGVGYTRAEGASSRRRCKGGYAVRLPWCRASRERENNTSSSHLQGEKGPRL